MKITKRYWIVCALVAPVLLLSACGSSTPTAPTAAISLTGAWSVVANTTFNFTLNITQAATNVTGTMHSLSTQEPDTPISGTFDGTTITFTRQGAPWAGNSQAYTQVYTGIVSSDGKKLAGTYSHNGSGAYAWSATR